MMPGDDFTIHRTINKGYHHLNNLKTIQVVFLRDLWLSNRQIKSSFLTMNDLMHM